MIKIEKGIQITSKGNSALDLIGALGRMDIGDSFEVKLANSTRTALLRIFKTHGYKTKTRRTANGQMRVWLVAKK